MGIVSHRIMSREPYYGTKLTRTVLCHVSQIIGSSCTRIRARIQVVFFSATRIRLGFEMSNKSSDSRIALGFNRIRVDPTRVYKKIKDIFRL